MLLEDRVLWGAVADIPTDLVLRDILEKAIDVRIAGRLEDKNLTDHEVLRCLLRTPIQYTRDSELLKKCTVRSKTDLYDFEFLGVTFRGGSRATAKEPTRMAFCGFFVPFRNMLGGVLRRIASSVQGNDYHWCRVSIMPTVKLFKTTPDSRLRGQKRPGSKLCGLDLHLVATKEEQEIVFVGMNPAHNRVFQAVSDESGDFTLTPISTTFCVGSDEEGAMKSYFTIDRNGVVNVNPKNSIIFVEHMKNLFSDLERIGTLARSTDRPVYRSRNAHKKEILASISA